MNVIAQRLSKNHLKDIPFIKHHASDETVKEFKSKWKVWVEYPDVSSMQEESPRFWEEYFDEAKDFAESSFESDKGIILDVAKEEIPTIKDIEFRLTPENAIMTVTYSEKPTDEILKSTAEYIEGQYSDGWGEGLEQQEFTTFEESDSTGRLYVKLWPYEDFKMNY